MSILAQISCRCSPPPVCRVRLRRWMWWWRRSRWRWRWWWSSRAGTAPPSSRSPSSLSPLALSLLPSWTWKAEPHPQVQLRPRRWFSSSCRCTWRSWPTTRSRWRPSATSTSSPTCSRKITSASLPPRPSAWSFVRIEWYIWVTYAVLHKTAKIRTLWLILRVALPKSQDQSGSVQREVPFIWTNYKKRVRKGGWQWKSLLPIFDNLARRLPIDF